MNTIPDNAGLKFGLKCTRLVVTGLQHCLVSEILKEKHTVRHLVLYLALFERRQYSVLLTIRNLRKNFLHTNIDVKHVC